MITVMSDDWGNHYDDDDRWSNDYDYAFMTYEGEWPAAAATTRRRRGPGGHGRRVVAGDYLVIHRFTEHLLIY